MIDTTRSLAAIRAALEPISPDSSEGEMQSATDAATDELRQVGYSVAAFANGLDDGVGFFNSSTVFGEQLVAGFDERRRLATLMGMVRALGAEEVLRLVEFAVLRLNVASGPSGFPRVVLSAGDRAALGRISDAVASTLLDAEMPADPEDED